MHLDAAKRQDDELEISSFDSRSDEEKIMDELLQEDLEDDQLLKNMTKNKSWQLRTDEVVSVNTTMSPKKSKKFKNVSFFEINYGFVFRLFDSSETINYRDLLFHATMTAK